MKAETTAGQPTDMTPVNPEITVGASDTTNQRLKAEEAQTMAETAKPLEPTAKLPNETEADYKRRMTRLKNQHSKRARRMVYGVKKGFIWNPLLKYPRNEPCPCGSGKKFKKCHLDQLPTAIPTAAGKDARQVVVKK